MQVDKMMKLATKACTERDTDYMDTYSHLARVSADATKPPA